MARKIGSVNITFGWVWALLFLLCGAFLSWKMKDPNWGTGETLVMSGYFKAAHVHGLGLAFLNIFYGLTIGKGGTSDRVKQLGSLLAIAGAVIFSLSLSLIPFMKFLEYLMPLGGLCVIAAVLIMVAGEFKSATASG